MTKHLLRTGTGIKRSQHQFPRLYHIIKRKRKQQTTRWASEKMGGSTGTSTLLVKNRESRIKATNRMNTTILWKSTGQHRSFRVACANRRRGENRRESSAASPRERRDLHDVYIILYNLIQLIDASHFATNVRSQLGIDWKICIDIFKRKTTSMKVYSYDK